jgi:hypothetical protein
MTSIITRVMKHSDALLRFPRFVEMNDLGFQTTTIAAISLKILQDFPPQLQSSAFPRLEKLGL